MLSASASNKHSLLSFGRNGETGSSAEQLAAPHDFLPSVSFDDLQTSIESASTEFTLTQFPSPKGAGSILDKGDSSDDNNIMHHSRPSASSTGSGISRPPVSTAAAAAAAASSSSGPSSARPSRSSSIARRSTASGRQASISSVTSSSSGAIDPPAGPAAMRGRRQSHYPPVSNGNAAIAKPSRRSVGSGVIGDSSEATGPKPTRRPSLGGGRPAIPGRKSLDMLSAPGQEPPRTWATSRAAKAKSVQPPPRQSQTYLGVSDALAPDPNRLSTLAQRSPRHGNGGLSTPSSGAKRASMMPGSHGSHAHGLGARTISPTDTRRAKRMSTMPSSQSLNQAADVPPPPPVSADTRAESRSPSMIPKAASGTPTSTSTSTTPDINRKSFTSGLPGAPATTNGIPVRTSIGPTHPQAQSLSRISQSFSISRLPAPKQSTVHNLSADDDEEVPPVPAIPKAYDSPKGSPAESFVLERKRSALSLMDATSIHSNSTGSIAMPVHPEPTKLQRKRSERKRSLAPGTASTKPKRSSPPPDRRNLQPLSLPPINLGPLNIPNLDKAKKEGSASRDLSPPPSRQIAKTPTTPMTASRSTFFPKNHFEDLPPLRSSSSVHVVHGLTPTPPDGDSSESSLILMDPEADKKSGISPFLSSSAPKSDGFGSNYPQRPKTGGDFPNMTGVVADEATRHQKPAGPRPPRSEKQPPKSPTPPQSAEDPATPSSMSSIRRKLSITWKRDKPKGSGDRASEIAGSAQQPQAQNQAPPLPPSHQQQQQQQQQQQRQSHPLPPQPSAKQESMPPPRIPISSTVSNLSSTSHQSPSPSTKTNGSSYLETKRRKSSTNSLNQFGTGNHDRPRGDAWGGKKEVTTTDVPAMPSSRNHQSVMNKFLKSKPSSHGMKGGYDPWTAELDKDDMAAEDEMRKLGSRRKETEIAARTLDALRKRATPKERVGPHEAIRIAMLNIYERGEIIDYNDIFFCGTQGAPKVVGDLHSDKPNFGYDDDRGDYTIIPGDHLAYRYEIVDVLGKGSFGQVVRCIDHKLGVLVAIKIIRNKKRFHQQALVEVNILKKLRDWTLLSLCVQDPHNKYSMVNFTQSFYFRGHLCISTELLDMNLYEFIKTHAFRGFSLRIIRRFTKQILSSLNVLQQKKVIHCDLKPENILLRHPLHSEIKVIDFGSSCFENEKVYTYIQSRFYRSPEVILGMTYGMPIDMWSVGCILAELYTGVPIFPGENEQEQLACIMEVFGPPEKHLIEKSTRKKLFFDSMGKPRLTVSSKGRRRRPSSKTLQQVLKCDDEAFLDFLARCLRWDPERRMRPDEAVRHEFITGRKTPPRMPVRDASSPVRRHNTTSASASSSSVAIPRPLPEPPTTTAGHGGSSHKTMAATMAPTARTGPSPHKAAAHRRASGVTAPTAASSAKRTSGGNGSGSGSGNHGNTLTGSLTSIPSTSTSSLPRASGRTASGRYDAAAVGASAAMTARRG
ncbi:hypothetical protein GMORB2_2570 [Geosmithia morbida]|uniref:Protein kinase domain-containing protein n=1 Tax=Geosmithia morbida TaxID=1094350 RepID=A0A9P5CZ20_9HYPO|nr:uncharacterized protein GMORB2_2570 [Geosmithia morbida]KAF4121083.1 hypothetical protein GMORB2_2570 [Geosmithia morbida]